VPVTVTKPYEVTLPLAKRDKVRAELCERIPWWYDPWAHLIGPSAFGLGAIAVSLAVLSQPTWGELLTVPIVLVLINVGEWHIHRYILHRRFWPLEELYYRHTPEHHVVFVRDDMTMRSTREFRLVLIPAYGIVAIFLSTLPVTAALAWLVSSNVAALWVASTMGYTVLYEWLHLSYHLPADHPIGRNPVIGRLRRHHAIHHTPELMQRWNFNVTVPLGDLLLGTVHGGGRVEVAGEDGAPAERASRS
jgi:hypothetical protein